MRAVVDDTRHSVLGKARALSQTALDAFAAEATAATHRDLLGLSEYGRYEVREVDVKSALTPCRMPGEPWSLNPYTGCSHDCAYCYVPDVAHVERPKWGSYVVVKRNLPTVLGLELKRKERRSVFLSSATDPYQPAEAHHRVTRRALELLVRAQWPVRVLSRNPLLKRDVDLFRSLSDLGVSMSVPTLDEEARRLVEPGAPPIEGRLRTLRFLADEGFEPTANLMPTFPPTGGVTADDVAAAFAEAGVRAVVGGAWRYVPSYEGALRARLGGGALADAFVEGIRDEERRRRWFRDLRRAFDAHGVPLTI